MTIELTVEDHEYLMFDIKLGAGTEDDEIKVMATKLAAESLSPGSWSFKDWYQYLVTARDDEAACWTWNGE